MKIIITVTNDLSTDQRVNRIAKTLQSNGHKVILAGRYMKNSKILNPRNYSTKRFYLLFSRCVFFYAEYNLRLFLFLLFSRYDLSISCDLDTLPANYFASVLRRKKLIYDCHELFTEVPELLDRNFTKSIWLKIERIILPHVKFSCTVSSSIAEYYRSKYGISMKVIRNLPYYSPVRPEIKNKLNYDGKKIIIYQGSVNTGRGVDLIIKSMQFISNAVFVVIGDGDVLKEMQSLVVELNLGNKVIFKGRLPFEELPQYTVQADIGLVLEENRGLSYYYSLSNKLFDYIQARVPVLGSPFPEIKGIIERYGIGQTIANHEISEIKNKIEFMLDNIELRKTWKQNLGVAARELCWENEEKILYQLL